MSFLTLNEQGSAPSPPSAAKVKLYVDNTANPILKLIDDGGLVVTQLDGRNTAAQVAGKDFVDTSTTISNVSAASKALAFSLGGMTAGQVLTIASAQVASQTLNLPVTRQAETLAVKPQIAGALVAAPTGIANVSGLMLGLANLSASNIITPQVTGRVCITISGVVAQSTTADGAFWHIRTGTGTAPSNGGALAGTQTGGQQSMTYLTGVLKVPFSITSYMTGATLGTALWIDLVLATVTAGTATMTQVMVAAFEF